MPELLVRINDIIEGTEVNGPGYRLCVWFQGCDRNCPGCFNPETHPAAGGRDADTGELAALMDSKSYDGLSVSGGEPFLQPAPLRELLIAAKSRGLDTLVFTGFTFAEIEKSFPDILPLVDYLVDGPYEKDNPSRSSVTGSGNQRFLRLEGGKVAGDLTETYSGLPDMEIMIAGGEVKVTGFAGLELN